MSEKEKNSFVSSGVVQAFAALGALGITIHQTYGTSWWASLAHTPDLPDSFYFIDYSAFSDRDSANKELKILKEKKYDRAGIFWIPDYPNLSGKKLFEVYADRFNDRRSCAEHIKYYRNHKPEAYCAFASKNKNDNPDRFYSDPK
jgi:serine/threonine protein kinase, bacterial